MTQDFIKIRGAREHNLQNIDLDLPKNKLIVITGVSGSGKSSLAFDTLYAEGRRRYVESLSTYARQFLGMIHKPDLDRIEGISPAISIDQRRASHNPRSTVGTLTEVYDYFRLLFARAGKPHCPKCGKELSRQTVNQIVDRVLKMPKSPRTEIIILGPVIQGEKGEHQKKLEEIQRAGFLRVRIDGIIYSLERALRRSLDKNKKHLIEVVVDSLALTGYLDKIRLIDSVRTALRLGGGIVTISQKSAHKSQKSNDLIFSEHFACQQCGISLPELEPRLFSFNSPYGACPACQGLGVKLEVDPELIIPNPNLSISEGAIFPCSPASRRGNREGYFWWQLSDLAKREKIDLDLPVRNLSKKKLNLILEGDRDFEGVIPWLERKYRETDSDYTRAKIEQYMVEKKCEVCRGKRLRPEALAVRVAGKSIDQLVEMPISKTKRFFEKLLQSGVHHSETMACPEGKHSRFLRSEVTKGSYFQIAEPIIKEIIRRLQFLIEVGLDYLTLDRKAGTLAGGEEQRIRLTTQIGSKLSGVLYVLDEPSIGLHPRDQGRLIKTLKKLVDLGNTVVVVEHDPQTILAADCVIDIGPGAGREGGKLIFEGTAKKLLKSKTLTGEYLSGRKKVVILKGLTPGSRAGKFLIVKGAREHNLRNIDVKIPLGNFVGVTGVSGSGKSSLVNDILAKALMKKFYRAKKEPGQYQAISGTEYLNKVVLVDQSPIGRTPRSNPATYSGAFSYIRNLFSQTKEAKLRGYGPGRFSFNVRGGRCEVCEGQGQKKVEMYFLADTYIQCPECKGKRFNSETLAVEYQGKNIADVLEMTIEEALKFFEVVPGLSQKLKILNEVGLGYLQLGQPAPSLSGGEAQRVKLAAELSKKGSSKTLYILDEPTTGLHPEDIRKLVFVLRKLVDKGNTVLVVEHNLDLIKNVDWIIDLGPEGGEKGGEIVAEGKPSQIVKNKESYTGKYLREALI